MPPEPPRTSWSALPEVGHLSKPPHAPSSLAVLTRAGEQMRGKKKKAHFQSLAGGLAGPPSEHVVRELSFPSHITCYYYYHFSDTLKRLASALQVVITAQYESSNMWDVVLNNV